MQQNARVIILTLDAARAAGLELARPLDALEAAAAASPSSSSSSSSSNAGLNGRARPTPSTERSAALSSVDDDSESESDDEDDGESERGGEGNDAPPSASSSSSLFDRPAGFTAIARPPPPPSLSGYRPMTPVERTRGVAATLLLSFLGARLNSAFSLGAFVETVAGEYRAGRAAAALLAPLTDEELASVGADAGLKVVAPTSKAAAGSPFGDGGGGGSGGGGGDDDAPETATAGSGAAAAGRALLSQWVSIAYMTMAQMGVPHALSKSPGAQGWAFAGGSPSTSASAATGASSSSPPSSLSSSSSSSSSSVSRSPSSEAAAEALALDRLVRSTLRQFAEERGLPPAAPSETLEALRREARAKVEEVSPSSSSSSSSSSSPAAPASFMRVSDPRLASTSSALEVWGMAVGLSSATAEHVAARAEEWGLLEGGAGGGGGSGSGGDDSSSPGSPPSSSSSEMAAAGEQS